MCHYIIKKEAHILNPEFLEAFKKVCHVSVRQKVREEIDLRETGHF